MKKIFLVLLIAVIGFTLSAMPHERGNTQDDILDILPEIGDKTIDELTISERLSISEILSVQMQKNMYVRHAAKSSFIIPGLGQFMTGDPLAGTLHLVGEAAIIGGVITGLYFLLPDELLDGSLTKDERHDLMENYHTPDNIGEILPAMGVVVGGVLLSVINSMLASHGAAENALVNIESGDVTFQPYVNVGKTIGIGLRMNWK
jgi:hypothetical protein